MKISGTILSNLCHHFHYEIGEKRVVLFGIRSSLPTLVLKGNPEGSAELRKEHRVRSANLNYTSSRCTVGIWDKQTDLVSLFPGSTVPSVKYLFENQQALRHFNILQPGKYELRRGLHPREKSGFQRHEAFLMDGFGHVTVPSVRITKRRLLFNFDKNEDKILLPGDNLHAGRIEPGNYSKNPQEACREALRLPFSSSGCITIVGQPVAYLSRPPNGTEWNSWVRFMQNIDDFDSESSASLPFLLFDYKDFNSPFRESPTFETRYGASGQYIRKAQRILSSVITHNTVTPYYTGLVDGCFERETISALLSFQNDFYATKKLTKPDLLRFFEHTRHFITQH